MCGVARVASFETNHIAWIQIPGPERIYRKDMPILQPLVVTAAYLVLPELVFKLGSLGAAISAATTRL